MTKKTAKKTKIKLPSFKAMGQAVVNYRIEKAAGKIGTITALENISHFFGKKGQLLKRETRYNVQRAELTAGIKEAQRQLGKRPGKATFERVQEKRKEAKKKAAKTFAEKNVRQTKQGKADKRFKKQAQKIAGQFMNAVDVFASDTYEQLREKAFGVGSDVVITLAEAGLEPEDIEKYLQQVMETWEDIPTEARGLAASDEFWKATTNIITLIHENDKIDFSDVLKAYIETAPDPEEFNAALANYIVYDDDSKSFSEVWDELKDTMDPGNMNNLSEIYEE